MVKEYEPFILSYIATMFFGVQFESIDKRRLKVVEIGASASPAPSTGGNTGGNTGGGNAGGGNSHNDDDGMVTD